MSLGAARQGGQPGTAAIERIAAFRDLRDIVITMDYLAALL